MSQSSSRTRCCLLELGDEMVQEDGHFKTSQISAGADARSIAKPHEWYFASLRALLEYNNTTTVTNSSWKLKVVNVEANLIYFHIYQPS